MDPDLDDLESNEEVEFDPIQSIDCTICGEIIASTDIMSHMLTEHPHYIAMWAAFLAPAVSEDDVVSWIQTQYDLYGIEADSYEYYTQLCDSIGNHYVGVEDVESAAPAVIASSESYKGERCPICLEPLESSIYARRTKTCRHIFCGPCIETWFEKHKSCPVCKCDVTDQMASISTSSPDSLEGSPVEPSAAAPASESEVAGTGPSFMNRT